METQTSLVRSDGRIELDTIAGVCLHLPIVVNPCHLESEYALRLNDTLNNLGVLKFRMLVIYVLYGLQNFMYSLEIFLLVRVLGLKLGHQFICFHCLCYKLCSMYV